MQFSFSGQPRQHVCLQRDGIRPQHCWEYLAALEGYLLVISWIGLVCT